MARTGHVDPEILAGLLKDTPRRTAQPRGGHRRPDEGGRGESQSSASGTTPAIDQFEARVAARIRTIREGLSTAENRRSADVQLDAQARGAELAADKAAFLHAADARQRVEDAQALLDGLSLTVRAPRLPDATGATDTARLIAELQHRPHRE